VGCRARTDNGTPTEGVHAELSALVAAGMGGSAELTPSASVRVRASLAVGAEALPKSSD